VVSPGKPERILHIHCDHDALPVIHVQWDCYSDRYPHRHTIPDGISLRNGGSDSHDIPDGHAHSDRQSVTGLHATLYRQLYTILDTHCDVCAVREL
jgi:hypothetical protein